MTGLSRCIVLATLACCAFALQAQAPYRPIEQRLTAQQLVETGLDRLDAAQLQRLNALLRDEQDTQVAATREQVAQEAKVSGGSGFANRDTTPIVSRIDGTFAGWSAGTRLRLANGDTWRVIGGPDYYVPKSKATTAPGAVVAPGLLGGWYLQVEGHGTRAKVQRVD